jgi:hypothetical protein
MRPRKFNSIEELEQKIEDYFRFCDSRIVDIVTRNGIEQIKKPKPYTIEGLAAFLNMDRRSLLNYEKQKGYESFFPTIKNAKARILANLVERGLDGDNNSAMGIFNLKNNYGYTDKSSLDLKIDGKELSDEELNAQIDKFESRNK